MKKEVYKNDLIVGLAAIILLFLIINLDIGNRQEAAAFFPPPGRLPTRPKPPVKSPVKPPVKSPVKIVPIKSTYLPMAPRPKMTRKMQAQVAEHPNLLAHINRFNPKNGRLYEIPGVEGLVWMSDPFVSSTGVILKKTSKDGLDVLDVLGVENMGTGDTVSPRPPKIVRAQEALQKQALKIIRERYGKEGLEKVLPFHGEKHTLAVIERTGELIKAYNRKHPETPLTTLEMTALIEAATFHDIVQLKGPGINELASIKEGLRIIKSSDIIKDPMFKERMEKFERLFELAILNTTPVFTAEGTITQPKLKELLEAGKITKRELEKASLVSEADLGAFGKPFNEFWLDGLKLRKEFGNSNRDITVKEALDWANGQLNILRGHNPNTKYYDIAFPHKVENIKKVEGLIKELEKIKELQDHGISSSDKLRNWFNNPGRYIR